MLSILKLDNYFLKINQNNIENNIDFINQNNLYTNTIANYTFFTKNNIAITEKYTIDVCYNKFSSDFDSYFESNSYLLNNSSNKIFFLINPKYKQNLFLSEIEKLFLNLLNNGLNLIKLSNENLINNLIIKINDYTQSIVQLLLYINLSAIIFTIIFSIFLLIMFLKLFSKQEELLYDFVKIDVICTVKMIVMCDKFLIIINQTPNDMDAYRKLYRKLY